jgi:hypothetical protein
MQWQDRPGDVRSVILRTHMQNWSHYYGTIPNDHRKLTTQQSMQGTLRRFKQLHPTYWDDPNALDTITTPKDGWGDWEDVTPYMRQQKDDFQMRSEMDRFLPYQ